MEIDSIIGEVTSVREFKEWIDSICKENNLHSSKYDEKVKSIIDHSYDEILALSSEECFACSITLMNYAIYLQSMCDRINSVLSYSNALLDRELSKVWTNYDKYIPAEVKRQMIVKDNSYMTLLEKCRLRLSAVESTMSESCKDIKRKVSLYQDFAKKRGFNQ